LFGTVEVRAPRFEPCHCSDPAHDPLADEGDHADCCAPEYERVLAEFGAMLPYRRAGALRETFFPAGDLSTIDTIQRRTLQVGARRECAAIVTPTPLPPRTDAETIALSIACGHVRAVRRHQVQTFEVFVAQGGNDEDEQIVFSRVPVEADRQTQQRRGVLLALAQHRARSSPSSAMAPTGRGRWERRRALVRPVMGLTGSTWRCASSLLPRQSKAGLRSRTKTAEKAPVSPMLWSTSAGACGTARCSGHLI
jgi:hypothetical protein